MPIMKILQNKGETQDLKVDFYLILGVRVVLTRIVIFVLLFHKK